MSGLWDRIDLDKHGVIEAHAGTGKTYTIVQLVLRMLESTAGAADGTGRLVHIREIMVVTFTEKAAGELKERIRKGIEERIASFNEDDDITLHLEDCLNNLHEALLGTIHAVCLRLLQTWPFESGVPFTTEIVDDTRGIESALRESMRTDWQDTATSIPWALERLAATGTRIEEKHFDLLRTTAKELLDDEYVKIDRTPVQDANLRSMEKECTAVDRELDELRGSFHRLVECLLGALEEANENGLIDSTKRALLDKRLSGLRLVKKGILEDVAILRNPLKCGTLKIVTQADLKKKPALSTVVSCSRELAGHAFVEAMARKTAFDEKLLLTLIYDGAELLARRWQHGKQENGFISYQDMLRLMYKAVTGRPSFTEALRKKLRFAIIDEFQDTSRLQWEVFKSLFLTNDTPQSPRLYIVGDPKQSIYAFQGADVRSYLDAKTALQQSGNDVFTLSDNYRSLDALIRGYNAVFTADTAADNWFKFGAGEKGISYETGSAVTSPIRREKPEHPVPVPPLQVMVLEGAAPQRRKMMATYAGRAIKSLIGTTISIPEGAGWKPVTLTCEHFAVIVEAHTLAGPFLEAFREEGIPAVKYKMEGVFQSPMTRALHALLKAVLSPSGDPAPRLAALLTPFFNRPPESIDPEHDLEPCRHARCHGDALCIAHALQEWTGLACGLYWSQLFDGIQRRTGMYGRLIRLGTGERDIADLRQVIDYCIELLYCENYTLEHLVEHLGSLLNGETSAGQERNLHVLETQKSSVKVLTMHAAKGLEFPVVFVAAGGSKNTWKGPNHIRYTSCTSTEPDVVRHINVAPYLSVDDIRREKDGHTPERCFLEQAHQERRRLLYVALTRAQVLLFVPMQLDTIKKTDMGGIDWIQCERPSKGGDHDLTPKLQELLATSAEGSPIVLFDPEQFPVGTEPGPVQISTADSSLPKVASPDIHSLDLLSRVCRQTSYTQMSRQMQMSREIDRSEEVDDEVGDDITEREPSALPGGRQTGDALHCAIEELLAGEDVATIVADPALLQPIVDKYLKRNGIYALIGKKTGPDAEAIGSAVSAAVNCIRGALTTVVSLPAGGGQVRIAELAKRDRRAEMEFLLKVDRNWVHGFMDLVFRIGNREGGTHPWRYFVLDWKSDTPARYDAASINECIKSRHYDMQARLYSHALDRYLRGVLGDRYDPAYHLGGAVYLFVREHEKEPRTQATLWTYRSLPEEDAEYIGKKVTARQQ